MARDHISLRKNGIYFYVRRVPQAFAHLDTRKVIRESLSTRDENEARIKAQAIDKSLQTLWASLLLGAKAETVWQRYEAAKTLAKTLGFHYWPIDSIHELPLSEAAQRTAVAFENREQPAVVEAVMGTAEEPKLSLSGLVDAYFEANKAALTNKSPAQLRKHLEQRTGSAAVTIKVIGDKRLRDIVRTDAQKYRQHWVDRVAAGEITRESANRSISDILGMLAVVDAISATDYRKTWEGLRIAAKKQTRNRRKRPAYSLDFVQKVLLAPGALDGLNPDARMALYGMVETGMGPSEIANLRPEDIVLDHEVPHVCVAERDDREQKTAYRIRKIPLVGVSLWAIKQRPQGFPHYQDNGTLLSNTINKFLRENKLRPSPQHSIYSLRHTFQDRLTDAKTIDRLQVDLMGHDLGREEYGEGSTLKARQEALEGIKFRWSEANLELPRQN